MPVIALTQGMGSLAQDIAEQLARELGLAVAAARGGRACGQQDARAQEPDQPAARRQGRPGRAPDGRPGSMAIYTAEEVLDAAAARQRRAARLGRHLPAAPGAARALRAHHAAVREARRVADGTTSTPTTPNLPKPRSSAATSANASRMHDQFGVDLGRPGAVRPGAQHRPPVGRQPACSRSRRCWRGPSSPRPRPRARCCDGMALSARVRAALKANDGHARQSTSRIDGRRWPGHAARHRRSTPASDAAAENVAAAVAGVAAVDNQLRVMASSRLFSSCQELT